MVYQVSEWTFVNLAANWEFSMVEKPTEGMKQAIVNNIRENGFLFDEFSFMAPVLNTGEAVMMDDTLCEELLCRAYGFDSEAYRDHLARVPHVPCEGTARTYTCEYPMRKVVNVTEDAFDMLKASLLEGDNNVELIPAGYVVAKKGDVIRFMREDKQACFDVTVKDHLPGKDADILALKDLDTVNAKTIWALLKADGTYPSAFHLTYRLDGASGEAVYRAFEKTYATSFLSLVAGEQFNCRIAAVVFDKKVDLVPTVLEAPPDVPVPDDIRRKMEEGYQASLREEEERKKESQLRYLKLKEKMKNKKGQQ